MGRHSGRFRVFSVCVWFSSWILQKKNHWYLWCNIWRTMFCSLPCSVSSGDTLLQAMDLLPMLIQTVEKAASQSTQIPMVTEGVAAALLICRMSVIEGQTGKVTKHPAESNMNSFWRITFFFFWLCAWDAIPELVYCFCVENRCPLLNQGRVYSWSLLVMSEMNFRGLANCSIHSLGAAFLFLTENTPRPYMLWHDCIKSVTCLSFV